MEHVGRTMNTLAAIDNLLLPFIWVAKLFIFLAVGIIVVYAFDREPPFAVISVEPAAALPGQIVKITANVRRDTHRNCSIVFSRYIFDGDNTRFFEGTSIASDTMIDLLEKNHPGKLMVAIKVPLEATPGKASIYTVVNYKCNKLHALWPIEGTSTLPFTISEPL